MELIIRLSSGELPWMVAVVDHRKKPSLYTTRVYGRNYHRLHIGPYCFRLWTPLSRKLKSPERID